MYTYIHTHVKFWKVYISAWFCVALGVHGGAKTMQYLALYIAPHTMHSEVLTVRVFVCAGIMN